MPHFFIINPGSRQGWSARFIPRLLSALDKRGIDHQYVLTKTLEEARSFSAQANLKGYEVVVAVGGDGTINRVINGFYDEAGNRISKARLGVIHTGTSPDFCHSYGIPADPALAFETLLKGKSKEISIARIVFRNFQGLEATGYYACCASLGMGARVAQRSNTGIRKYLGDIPGTLGAILISLCEYKASDLIMACDGEKVPVKHNFNTFIGKTAYIASGMKVEHGLAPDDDRLYVLSVKGLNLISLAPALKAVYSGRVNVDREYLSFRYARLIEVAGDGANPGLEYDGDPQGYLPCRISIAKDKLEVIAHEP
jgi:diacylglycerol kinase family enzyme